MSTNLRIGVIGATGALGREIVGVLDRVAWRPAEVAAWASATTSVSFVDFGEDKVPVDDLADADLAELDGLILAGPADVCREAGEIAANEGVPVVDCTGAFSRDEDVPMMVPWINPEVLEGLGARPMVCLPSPAALALCSVLGPLRRAGVQGAVDATVFVPASAWGRGGIEELSAQVVALFNQGTPPRRVFEDGLAFDLIPRIGAASENGWSLAENRAAEDVQRMLGVPAPVQVTLVGVPVFSGISANVRLTTPVLVSLDLVKRILADGEVSLPASEATRILPRPRRVDGEPFVQAGRLRTDVTGHGLYFWLSLDNLRGGAAAAVGSCGALLKRLGRLDAD